MNPRPEKSTIDARKRAEAQLEGEKRLLEMVASGSALTDVLTELCRFVEDTAGDCLCGIYLSGEISEPAWKGKPSWYLLTTEDRMIPPPAQRMMAQRAGATIVEAPGSHAIYVSQPEAVASLIKQAAQGAVAATAAS